MTLVVPATTSAASSASNGALTFENTDAPALFSFAPAAVLAAAPTAVTVTGAGFGDVAAAIALVSPGSAGDAEGVAPISQLLSCRGCGVGGAGGGRARRELERRGCESLVRACIVAERERS